MLTSYSYVRIDSLCHSIICSCMAESVDCVPTVRPRSREVSGWNDHLNQRGTGHFLSLDLAGVG